MIDEPEYPYTFNWKNDPKRATLFGKACRILTRGTSMNSVLVEFEDGSREVVSARSLRRRSDSPETAKEDV